MAAEPIIQFGDHVRYKDISYQRTLFEVKDPDV